MADIITHFLRSLAVGAIVLVLASVPAVIRAQEIIDNSEKLESERPEAWAMNYFTTVTLMSGLSVPHSTEPWSLEVGAEAGWIPHLSEGERTVGFNGTKEEDLNHSPVFARPRVTVGLPWNFALTLSYVPPIRIAGLKPHLFAFALERPLVERNELTMGMRLYGQVGNVKGPITCSSDVVKFPPGSTENPYGCEKKSNDKAIQRYAGVELTGAYRIERLGGLEPYVTVAANILDTEAHVDAVTFGALDRSRLESKTWTFSTGAGVQYPVTGKWTLGLGVFYNPLFVARPTGTDNENDALFNVRALISYEFR